MAVAGIIAEYNPFHRGHGWQVEELRRRLGADTAVVAAMSGNFVQRGDFALLNKHARAEAALMGGVDLVLELPTAWASATAEQFAWGGVSLLAATGVVTDLVFGSECGDLAALQAAARCLDSPDYGDALRRLLGEGMTFAKARQQAAEAIAGVELSCLGNPNDNLAVEYLRALRGQASGIQPLALPRQGAAHDSESATGFASASAIRRRILAREAWQELVPPGTAAVIEREMAAGRCPVTMQRWTTSGGWGRRNSDPTTGGTRGCTAGFTRQSAGPGAWRSCWSWPRPSATPWPGCGGCCCTAIWG